MVTEITTCDLLVVDEEVTDVTLIEEIIDRNMRRYEQLMDRLLAQAEPGFTPRTDPNVVANGGERTEIRPSLGYLPQD